MKVSTNLLLEQYALVKGARHTLFEYCRSIATDHFMQANAYVGNGGSICSLLVHVANTYEAWIAWRALGETPKNLDTFYQHVTNMEAVVVRYQTVDHYMDRFIQGIVDEDAFISYEKNGLMNTITPFQLFTHVITHEFHHKGQILSLSRQLGYTPVDTDILR